MQRGAAGRRGKREFVVVGVEPGDVPSGNGATVKHQGGK